MHTRQAPTSRAPELVDQRVRNLIVRSSDLFFLSPMENDNNTEVPIAAGGRHLLLQKKASGPLDVYWKTALSDDLCKHFLNEFMVLLTYFWSVLFFPSIINKEYQGYVRCQRTQDFAIGSALKTPKWHRMDSLLVFYLIVT